MNEVVIRAEGLGKRYRVGEREPHTTLRDALAGLAGAPARFLRGAAGNGRRGGRRHIWAIRGVSLEVHPGEVVGIVGRNGSGKSTLLKVLARITRPTEGWAEVRGRVGTLLEIGTGFHPELTGRENAYLSGAILGMKRGEIARKFDEIVAFAELESFMDTPVKYYSSGMYTRLAFAVAAHLEADILFVDEVLAVGDLGFQRKCLGKMDEAAHTGRTVLFVSHQMNQIRRLCKRCLWFDAGEIRASGPTVEVVTAYEASFGAPPPGRRDEARLPARFVHWEVQQPKGEKPNFVSTFGDLRIRFVLEVHDSIRDGIHEIELCNQENQLLWSASVNHLKLAPGTHDLVYHLPSLPLRPGAYRWRVTIWDGGNLLDAWTCLPEMVVVTEPLSPPSGEWQGLLNLPWRLETEKHP